MDKLRMMNKNIFEKNLVASLIELLKCPDEEAVTYKFMITPVFEANKNYNSNDDIMRLIYFSEKNIKDRVFNIGDVVKLFSALCPLYPMWIQVSICDRKNKIIELRNSMRFRRPSQIQNVDTGHPPFIVVA